MRRRKHALASHSMDTCFEIHACLDKNGREAHIYKHHIAWDDVVYAYRHMYGSAREPEKGPHRHLFVGRTRGGRLIEVAVDEDVNHPLGSYTAIHAQLADNSSFNTVGLTKKEIRKLMKRSASRSIVPGVGRYDETPISDVRYDMDEIERQYSVRPDKPVPGRVFCPGLYFHELVEMYERGEIELYDDLDEEDGLDEDAPRAASR